MSNSSKNPKAPHADLTDALVLEYLEWLGFDPVLFRVSIDGEVVTIQLLTYVKNFSKLRDKTLLLWYPNRDPMKRCFKGYTQALYRAMEKNGFFGRKEG